MNYQAGALIRVRNRDWIVLPSNDNNLLLLKPLGGSEEEITGIYLPLKIDTDVITSTEFPHPEPNDIGDLESSKILYNAARLSFRSGAGPFRSLAKLSFRPRSYQMVPLIMSLKQETVRLLIADDVGVGKTIEALLIVKELLERKEIERFALICPPHLCDQWQIEMKDKFGIEAVIIRSNTQGKLDREIQTIKDESVYDYYKYQIISIDYIKSDQRCQVFIQQCPEMIIVDEAHTATKPAGASRKQQQRYNLLYEISKKENQNLILLTATPHSGKQEEFQSLLGLLNIDYEDIDISNTTQQKRKELAEHFVQRRRADVVKWLNEDTPFPVRESEEIGFNISGKYLEVFNDVLSFAQNLTMKEVKGDKKKRYNYWAALALLRGVMSSPSAGVEMIKNKLQKNDELNPEEDYGENNPLLEDEFNSGMDSDYSPSDIITKGDLSGSEVKYLKEISEKLERLKNIDQDSKAKLALEILLKWISEKYNPVIFCKYIATAKYIGELLESEIKKKYKDANVQVITSEDPDELRKERINDMTGSKIKILIATDCLSEGINLQDSFNAVLHYDLPWNPNKLEQREGRVDRFGQTNEIVKTCLIYGSNNPVDGVVLEVIINKVKQIRRDIHISIPFPEDSKSIMNAVLHSVLLNKRYGKSIDQYAINFKEDSKIEGFKSKVTKELDAAAKREKESRSIFAQNAIKPKEIEEDLTQTDISIGKPEDVRDFVISSLKRIGVQINEYKKGYKLFTSNLPQELKGLLEDTNEIKISFYSPTPEGYKYIGRNHIFVEQLCNYIMGNSIMHNIKSGAARAAVIKTNDVKTKTTLLLYRVRNVIEEKNKKNQLVAEEMIMTGYEGSVSTKVKFLSFEESKNLLFNNTPSGNITKQSQDSFLEKEIEDIKSLQKEIDKIAIARAENLVEAHERFRKTVGGFKYQTVEPILPMDLMGIYILLPNNK
jgi:superfamily II DNA or RNA helicase